MPITQPHLLHREPVVISTVVGAALTLLVQFGVPISDGQANAITGLIVAALALYARSRVTPAGKD